jgi:hypothetical protein
MSEKALEFNSFKLKGSKDKNWEESFENSTSTKGLDYKKFLQNTISQIQAKSPQSLSFLNKKSTESVEDMKDSKSIKKAGRRNKAAADLWHRSISQVILGHRALSIFTRVKKEMMLYGCQTIRPPKGGEQDEEELMGKSCLLHPHSRFKIFWNIVTLLLLIYTASFVPFKIAFLDTTVMSVVVIDYIVDFLFATDIFVNFFCAYYDDDRNLIVDRKVIAIRYLKSWFIFDLIVCFPMQLVLPNSDSNQYNGLLRLLKLPRLYRVFRIFKMLKVLKNAKNIPPMVEKMMFKIIGNSGMMRLLQTLLTLFIFVHLFGCFWFLIAKLSDYDPDTW